MSNFEKDLAAELEKELPASIRDSLADIKPVASRREVQATSFLDQFQKMERIGETLEEQVRMRLVEVDHSFQKKATEMAIAHKRSMSSLVAAHKAQIEELEALLKKLR